MAEQTAIEWCDATFNPWIGCTKVSPACDHCYAAVSTPARTMGIEWGAGQPRRRTSVATMTQPLRWNARPFYECMPCGWRGEHPTHPEDGGLWICPECSSNAVIVARRRVFCASLADVFDNEVDPQWRADLFDLIAATPKLDWLLLTKRIGNVASMVPGTWRPVYPRNVWLGATICNQAEADRDIPKLLQVPAAVRFVSMEPLLGAVDLRWFLRRNVWENGVAVRGEDYGHGTMLDWVIAGGESGTEARPMHPSWVRALRDQCAAAGVPFLFKQWGEWAPYEAPGGYDWRLPKGDFVTWDSLSSYRPFHPNRHETVAMRRVGKKRAGRTLDGVQHTAFPRVR